MQKNDKKKKKFGNILKIAVGFSNKVFEDTNKLKLNLKIEIRCNFNLKKSRNMKKTKFTQK